ncbi:hypothetical protein E8E12_011207 [Didymella heteroderae]|uniref:Uncharacterized protein n=1 Tax=Didymella heteroderae TaxID=1769908 RepID=A0A9P5C675_9PLEO|nr:hypothetical protein E8E12_011207 [Didymella heteroderae]
MHKNSDWKAILKATFWHPDQAVINSINNMLESFHESMCRSPIAPFSRPMHIRSTCDYWHSRRLFITTEGNIGLGPAAMQPADIVAILSRVDHPAILRREQQGWTLIGLAYIAVFDQEYMGTRWTGHGERLQFFDLK